MIFLIVPLWEEKECKMRYNVEKCAAVEPWGALQKSALHLSLLPESLVIMHIL